MRVLEIYHIYIIIILLLLLLLGWLSIINPMKIESCYKLNLKRWEDKQLLRILMVINIIFIYHICMYYIYIINNSIYVNIYYSLSIVLE